MRYTKHDLAIAILTVYEQRKPGSFNKYNVLGRGDTRGNLELHLDVDFTVEERVLADKVVNVLVERDQLVPTYTDTQSPEDWLVITEAGERALQTGALDELDTLLTGLHADNDLLQMRYGAYDAVATQNTDWQRHAATSCRELITKVLHTISPDSEVKSDPHFVEDSSATNGITRKERTRHYLRSRDSSTSASRRTVIEKACDLVEACYTRLNAVTHADAQEVENLIKLTEDALYFLLK